MNQSSPILELQRQRMLLEIEYFTEKEAYRKLTESRGLQRLVKRGDAWFPLRVGKSYYNSLNQLCIEVFRTTDNDIEHNFEFGRPVQFFKGKPTPNPSRGEGSLNTHSTDKTINKANQTPLPSGGGGCYCRFFSFAPLSFPWLNPTQEQAVNLVLRAKDVAIVHGPPGTGKTTTLVEAIFETLHREPQVLVCAQSNMAVDWISERLVDRGVNVLRIGNPTRVNDKMLSFTYERRFEAHPDYELLWSIRKAIRELRQHRKRGSENWHQKMDRLKSRAAELEIRINAELFGEARVIACTLVGSANRLLEGQKYNTLFIDEAAQALEAACWIPIRRVRRVVLAGDHCQLPPTVKSLAALKAGLGRTLMERLVENHPEAVTLLGVQYRMNEEIMRFSSDWFYDGKVKSAPQVKHRSILDYDIPMEWIATDADGEEFVGESFGRINKKEAEQTLDILKQYFTKIGKTRILEERIDVGVISPYRAQVQYLRHLVKRDAFFKPYRSLISINTVDGFQGQERDVILISLVRSNDDGQIGFLRDLRRMNVAITRARMKLIILGNPDTMTRHPFYRKLYEYIEALREAAEC